MDRFVHSFGGSGHPRQRGVVLVVAMVFLLLLSLLAVTSMHVSLLEEKMVGGLRNQHLASLGAESALRAAESRLWSASSDTAIAMTCGQQALAGCYAYVAGEPNATVHNFINARGWVTAGATRYAVTDLTALSGSLRSGALASNPVFLIEDMGVDRPPGLGSARESGASGMPGSGSRNGARHLYRITARSRGGHPDAVRVLQSTFAARGH
ncbi:MAG: hypothetical protein KGJ91_00510 [Xanthomonadaceae bacterium]|nr:hypothetical protein [Xanthomonadaceae bacterium]